MTHPTLFTNHATGETFEVLPTTTSADAPAWVMDQIAMAGRILSRAQPMCPGYARLELKLIAADGAAEQGQVLEQMRAHLVATDCSRVVKAQHSEEWIFEGGDDEHND